MSKVKFEVGKYYKHTTGKIIKIVGAVISDTYGVTVIAEDMLGNFKPVGTDEGHTFNWSQIPKPRPVKSEDAPKAVTTKRWKPKKRQNYWYINEYGEICAQMWFDDFGDKYCFSQSNVFKTEAEAEKHLEYLKAKATIMDDAEDYEWTPGQDNYFGYIGDRKLHCESMHYYKHEDIWFKTQEAIEKSFKTHRKEWLIYLGVEEDE